jgi:hypothetical protein
MDEPHPYMRWGGRKNFAKHAEANPYPLGDLHHWPGDWPMKLQSSAAQLVNEYGWIWLWRDGQPAKLTVPNYDFYAGPDATAEQRWQLQAYWLALQTEWLRTERSLAGVLAFCYLTNNYGFTGDWFIDDIADLEPSPTLAWFRHCFAPAAVFIDLVDERYTKHIEPHEPGEVLVFNVVGVNDYERRVEGPVVVRLLDSAGEEAARAEMQMTVPAYGKKYVPVSVELPKKAGGYLLVGEFTPSMEQEPAKVLSRRYIKVGEAKEYAFFEYEPQPLEW